MAEPRPTVVGHRIAGAEGPPRAVVVAQLVQVAPVQPQPDATYRLNHKKLHITLAALEVNELTNEQVYAMAQTRGVLIEWSIGDELHSTPTEPNRPRHKHFFLHYNAPIQHRDARYCQLFDMIGNGGRRLHPHIQGVGPTKKDRAKVIAYTQKYHLYIASPTLMRPTMSLRSCFNGGGREKSCALRKVSGCNRGACP